MTDLSPDAREPTNPNQKLNRRGFLKGAAANAAAVGATYVLDALSRKRLENAEFQQINQTEPGELQIISVLPNWIVIGVEHTHQFLKKHKTKLESIIKAAKTHVCSEYFPDEKEEFMDLATPGTPIPEPGNFADSVYSFFAQIGQICATANKKILVANPQNLASEVIFWTQTTGPLGPGIRYSIEALIKNPHQPIDRRTFIKGAALTGISLLPQIHTRTHLNYLRLTNQFNNPQALEYQLNLLWHNYLDWRDVCVALGLQVAQKQLSTDTIPTFHGMGHNAVALYLQPENQETLKRKKALYRLLNAFGDRTVREFTYNHAQGRWTQTRALSY